MEISSTAMSPLAATLYAEAADRKYDTKVKIASSMINRLKSGKEEYGAHNGSVNEMLAKGYYAYGNDMYKSALTNTFKNKQEEKAYKESLGIISGLLKGTVKSDETEFYYTPEEIKKMQAKGKKVFDFSQVEEIGTDGYYKFYKYKNKTQDKDTYTAKIQSMLIDNGYDVGQVDGIMGPNTKKAFNEFKKNPENVAKIQGMLNKSGYDVGTIDGIWGERTKKAFMEYSKKNR